MFLEKKLESKTGFCHYLGFCRPAFIRSPSKKKAAMGVKNRTPHAPRCIRDLVTVWAHPGTGRVRNSSGRARHQFHSGALILLFLKKAQLVSCLILHCTRFCSGAEATAAVTAPAPSILLPPAVCAAGCCSLFFFTGASPDAQALMPLRCTVLSTVAQALCELQCK